MLVIRIKTLRVTILLVIGVKALRIGILLIVRIKTLRVGILLVIRIISLLIRIAEALLAISLLVAALTLLITVLLESALLVSSIIGAIAVLLIASAVFQAVVEARIGNSNIRSDVDSGDSTGNACQKIPEDKGQIQYEFIHFMSVHHGLAFVDAVHDSLFRIFRKYVKGLGIAVIGDDAGEPEEQGPEHYKNAHYDGQSPDFQAVAGIGK